MGLLVLILGGLAVGAVFGLGGGSDGDGDGDGGGTDEPMTLEGTSGSEELLGGSGDDVIDGNGGFDDIDGRGGDDTITTGSGGFAELFGGAGNDTIVVNPEGGLGNAYAYGGSGEDDLTGSENQDWLFAHGFESLEDYQDAIAAAPDPFAAFLDVPGGDTDADTLDGGAGDDLLYFSGGDTATGGDDSDTFHVLESDVILGASNPATITDWISTDGGIELYDVPPGAVLTLAASGGDALIQLDGETVVIVQGADGVLTLSDVSTTQLSLGD